MFVRTAALPKLGNKNHVDYQRLLSTFSFKKTAIDRFFQKRYMLVHFQQQPLTSLFFNPFKTHMFHAVATTDLLAKQ